MAQSTPHRTMTATIPDLCPELGLEVPVSEIDRELRKLWEQDDARTNATLMNLVVYSEKPGALLENSAIIRDLTREHACRAILVGVDRTQPDASVRAWITAHCHLAHGLKSVCCEQISLYLTGKVTGRFRNTVFAHLNSDLPLIFWWQGELTEIFSERLVSVIDRLIIDSSNWQNPTASFNRIDELTHTNKDIIIQDLEWSRSWQFRLGIAGLFDDPVAQRALPDITDIEIIHHPAHRNAALQLLAWLSAQASWRDGLELDLATTRNPATRQSFALESKSGTAITAQLIADPNAAALSSIRLKATGIELGITRDPASSHLTRHLQLAGNTLTSLSPADPEIPAQLVAQQLARGGKNSLYRKILPRFRQLLNR